MENKGRVACVSGGTEGIGRGIVERLLRDGYAVYTFSRTPEKCEALRQAHPGAPLVVLAGAVTDGVFRQRLVQEMATTHGRLDVLVNNAGTFVGGGSIDEPLEAWHETFETNVFGAFALTQACYPLLQRGEGAAVVNISSVCGLSAAMGCGSMAYSASKAAVDLMTTTLARDLGAEGIRVNSINPGVVDTPIWGGDVALMEARAKEHHVLQGKVIQSADIAAAVAFLASSEAGMITGAVLPVDAGYAVG